MKLCIEIPDELAKSGWLSDIADEGSEACWCSDDPDGLAPAAAFMYAVAHILNTNMLEGLQQAYLDGELKEAGE